MAFFEILAIAVGLALDAMAVSISAAAGGYARDGRAIFRLAFHFGLFQALMPVIGWFAGAQVVGWVTAIDHWLAFGLLALVAIRMIRAGLRPDCAPRSDPSRGLMLVLLALATSIDALAVGFSLALVGVGILIPCIVIGLVTTGLSIVGIRLGHVVSDRFGPREEILGGVILLGIGMRILLSHLLP